MKTKQRQMERLIIQATRQKHLVEFDYHGFHRIAEPHILGDKNLVRQALVYQLRGQTSSGGLPNWRRVDFHQVSGLRVLQDSFAGLDLIPQAVTVIGMSYLRWSSR
jgi:hypothetical protein